MKKILMSIATVALFSIIMVGAAFAANTFRAQPGVYDPDNTRIVHAAWVTGVGLPDPSGNANHALYLDKLGPTATNAASGATINGVEGIALTELGFDYKVGGLCTGGAPRFNVQASDGFHFMGGCGNGTITPTPGQPGWNRVRIDPSNPAQAFPPITPGATVESITLIVDEEGSVYLDNIDVNGTLIGKPGNAK